MVLHIIKKPRTPFHKAMIALTGKLLLAVSVITYMFYYYHGPGPLTQEKNVLFKRGTGFLAIVDQLEDEGVIRHGWLFKAMAVVQGDARKFKAGEYEFSAAISPRLIMDMIAEGKVVVHKLTISEGLTSQQVVELLQNQKLLDGPIVGTPAEGSILPETYHYTYGDYRKDLIERMQSGMQSTLAELWEKRQPDLPIKSKEEAQILASIVEKETGIASERGRVASVFINRLRKGMKLQSDPTTAYGLKKSGTQLTLTDLKSNNPYNTYYIGGLPPGPISNPGRAALQAVLNPPDTKDLYFVATGDGGHNFSATMEGHAKNVAIYRSVQRQQKEEKSNPFGAKEPAPEAEPVVTESP